MTTTNEIITSKGPIQFLANTLDISPSVIEAQNAFASKKIPAHAVQQRPARGGQVLSYVDHIYATESIQDGLLPTWSFELLDYEYFDDHSVLAVCKFTYHIPYQTNGGISWIPRTVTEAGNFTNDMKMPKAPAIAAATSRGLVRCLMRLFGFGIEFYKNDEEISPNHAWSIILDYAIKHGLTKEETVECAKGIGITKENIVDRFNALFDHIGSEIKARKDQPIPDLGNEPEPQAVEQAPAPEPEPVAKEEEPVVFDTWSAIDQWLQANHIDIADAIVKIKTEFGEYKVADCPKYQVFLAQEYTI